MSLSMLGKLTIAIVSVMLLFSVSTETGAELNSNGKILPIFRPTAKDKPLEKFYEEPKQADPLPASEIANIILPLSCLHKKDEDPREEVVKITITKEWIQKPILKDEPIFVLRIPIKMLEILDENPDPNLITFSYPLEKFEFYRTPSELSSNMTISLADLEFLNDTELRDKLNSKIDYTNFYAEWAFYGSIQSFNVFRVTGIVNPISYSNSGEMFRNYNEREIYLNREGDVCEIITDFTYDGRTFVWVAIYDEGQWTTPWDWLLINLTGNFRSVEYYFYIEGCLYRIWLRDSLSGNWYYKDYNDCDNPSTRINWLAGSTELYSNSISKYFRTETNPIRDDWTYSNGSWYRPNSTFYWHSYSSNKQYVYIQAWYDSNGRINTRHIAGSNIG